MNTDESLVDALADVLFESQPEPLGDEAARALARAALEAAGEPVEDAADADELVDAFAVALSASEPEALDDEEARALASSALAKAGRPAKPEAGAEVIELGAFRHAPLLAAAAVILFVVSAAMLGAPREAPPNVHHFASGHRIVAAPGAVLDWEESSSDLAVRLHGGEAMFDIDPDAEQRVRVVSDGVTVRVTGTVFTVGLKNAVTRVAVFEGNVAVTSGAALALLSAGDRWEGAPGAQRDGAFEPHLLEEASYAASQRAEHAARLDDFVPNLPPVPDLAADGRLPRDHEGEGESSEEGEESSAGSTPPTAPAPPPRIDDARRLLTERRYEEARRLADRALRGGANADWLMIRGDALRGEGSLDEAASEYTRAALVGDGRDRAVAGLSAARVLGRDLGRAGAAREILVSSGALDASSPVQSQAEALARELGIVLP